MQRLVFYLLLGLFLVSASSVTKAYGQPATPGESVPASSASTTPDQDRLQKLEQAVADAKTSADNAWMLMSAALVLLMTGPGLALFYGGLVRKKNVLATMMQSFSLMALVTVLWALFSYSLCFP